MNRRCFIQMGCYILVCLFLTISTASARVCFLPDSTDCGEGDVAGSGNVDVPCQYSSCPAYNTKYQTCYTERIYNNGGVNVECKQVKCILSKSECEKQEANPNSSQCCNFDSASGCYYMGSCKLCNRDVFDSEKNLGEGYDCYPCKDKNGTFYNCTAKEKECSQINPNYTSKCGDSQTAEEVKGVKDSKGNQCYTCKSKPIDKCVDIEATPFLDIIEPTVTTTAATKTETQTDATFRCGTGPTVETQNHNVVIDYNGRLTAGTSNYTTYSYDNATKKYYVIYKNSRVNNGKPLCLKNQLCSDYVSPYTTSSVYRDAYYIERAQGSYTSYASQTYCCLSGLRLSGRSVNELSSCKRAKTNTIQTDTAYRVNATYVCSVGETLSGTKCKKTTYTCPEGYTLDANNVCKQLTCNEGYTLQDVNGQKRCVADAYSCPTDGKYKYKLSGDKCVCDNSKTCSKISNGTWKGEKDKNTCPTGYKPKVVESTIGATAFSDGPCYKCEGKVTITIILDATNTTVNFSSISSDNKGYTVKLSLNGGGNDGITYPVTVTEGRTATYFSSTYEPGDCDVYGDNCDNDLGNGRETVSAASNLSVIINDQTVLNNLTTENEYLDMRYFIGKTYDTDNYIIKFVKAQTCSDIGYQTTPCSTGYKQIDYIQLPHEDCYTCSKCYKESSSGTVANKSTIYYYRADEPYKNGECASEMTLNVVCDNTNQKAKLYVNGKETQANPNSYQNTEGKWFGDFMNCTGCATVECTFKYGDKTKITIPQTGGPGD